MGNFEEFSFEIDWGSTDCTGPTTTEKNCGRENDVAFCSSSFIVHRSSAQRLRIIPVLWLISIL